MLMRFLLQYFRDSKFPVNPEVSEKVPIILSVLLNKNI